MESSRSIFRALAALGVTCSVVLAGCADRANDAVVLRYASPYGPGHPFSRADKAWMQYVEQRSNGRVRVQPFWGGSLMDESEGVRELAAGVADAAFVAPIYTRAGMHFIRGQTPFYDGAVDMHLQNRVFLALWDTYPALRAELDAVVPLIVTGGSTQDIMTVRRPIRSLDDLRGLRLRAPMEVTALLEKLGVDAEFMPMGEVYTALAKGTIDGVVAPQDTLRALRFADVVKYCTIVSLGRGAYYSRAMNRTAWNRLSADLQQVIDDSRAVWSEAAIAELTAAADLGHTYAIERGVEFIELPPEDIGKVRTLYAEMAGEKADELERIGLPGREAYALARRVIAEGR